MTPSLDVVAEGLAHPQGPDLLPNGDVVFVETYVGRISAWSAEHGVRTVADVGGAPNGCLLGADGAIYYTQNGWTVGPWICPDPANPGVGRVRLDGTGHEVLCELPDGIGTGAAHDLTWGSDGHLYFSDSGKFGMGDPNPKHTGYLYRLTRSGELEQLLDCEFGYPAGLVVDDSDSLIWVEARSSLLRRRTPDGEVRTMLEFADDESPEAVRLDAAGNLWIPLMEGYIQILSPEGERLDRIDLTSLGAHPLNLVFGEDRALYVIDFGHDLREHPNTNGRIIRVDVGVEGRPYNRSSITLDVVEAG